MIDNENLSSNGTNQEYMCPICGKELKKLLKKHYFSIIINVQTVLKFSGKKKSLISKNLYF